MEASTLNSLYTVGIAVITALSSTKAWDYWQKKQLLKKEQDLLTAARILTGRSMN